MVLVASVCHDVANGMHVNTFLTALNAGKTLLDLVIYGCSCCFSPNVNLKCFDFLFITVVIIYDWQEHGIALGFGLVS